MNEKIKIPVPVIVEGKYDKIRLSSVIDAHIVVTDGFGIFKKEEKRALVQRLAEAGGVAVLTDSDRGGAQIRRYLSSILPPDKIYNLYIPKIEGKERRKKAPSAAGTLGVEGIDNETLARIFSAFAENMGFDESAPSTAHGDELKKADLYAFGLSGCEDAGARRDAVAAKIGLPSGMSASALLGAVSVLMSRDEFSEIVEETFDDSENQGSLS